MANSENSENFEVTSPDEFKPGDNHPFTPIKPPLGIKPELINLTYGTIVSKIYEAKEKEKTNHEIKTPDELRDILLDYCNLILLLNGQPRKKDITNVTLDIRSECSYLGTRLDSTFGCKVSKYVDKKKNAAKILTDILVSIFSVVDKDLLSNTNSYINELYKTIQTYTIFFGMNELGAIYKPYIEDLVIKLNALFGTPIIIQRCLPNKDSHACSRIVTSVRKESTKGIDPAPPNSYVILLLSNDVILGGNDLEPGSNTSVEGGGRKRRFRKKTRRYRKNRNSRKNRRILYYL